MCVRLQKRRWHSNALLRNFFRVPRAEKPAKDVSTKISRNCLDEYIDCGWSNIVGGINDLRICQRIVIPDMKSWNKMPLTFSTWWGFAGFDRLIYKKEMKVIYWWSHKCWSILHSAVKSLSNLGRYVIRVPRKIISERMLAIFWRLNLNIFRHALWYAFIVFLPSHFIWSIYCDIYWI